MYRPANGSTFSILGRVCIQATSTTETIHPLSHVFYRLMTSIYTPHGSVIQD